MWESVLGADFAKIFRPDTPLLEIFVRGTLMYLGLFVMLRVMLKRQSATLGMTDLLVVVLLADAAQNGMANDYVSVTDGLFLVATILFWSYTLDWLGFRFPSFQRWLTPPPLELVKDGRILRRNMRRELITEGELMSQLREQGVEDITAVKSAHMESDGRISVIRFDEAPHHTPEPREF